MAQGRVEAIFIRAKVGAPPVSLERAAVESGKGIVGDRYHAQCGTYAWKPNAGRALTLIEAEQLERLAAEDRIALSAEESRRNVVTRGVALNDLVGRRFRIGTVDCLGTDLCEPCDFLAKVTETPALLRALVHRGGLRVHVETGGEIAVGDGLVLLD